MKLSFFLAMLSLLSAQVLALVFERAPENLALFRATPLLTPAGVSPSMIAGLGALLFMLFFARLRREPGPLPAGAYLTGMGHVGLQIVALEWLKPYVGDPAYATVVAFGLAAALGSWRAVIKKNEDDSMAMIAYYISTVAAIAFGYFVISHFSDLKATEYDFLLAGSVLGSVPAYFSSRACATQIFLSQPGGGRAVMKILSLYVLGGIWGGVIIELANFYAGVSYATVLVAGFYLLAAWLFTQGRSSGFVGVMLTEA